jgi:hypothetical protein
MSKRDEFYNENWKRKKMYGIVLKIFLRTAGIFLLPGEILFCCKSMDGYAGGRLTKGPWLMRRPAGFLTASNRRVELKGIERRAGARLSPMDKGD